MTPLQFTRSITVIGHGNVRVEPDEAHIHVGVRAMAATARDVSIIANQAMNSILAALTSRSIDEKSIQTGWFTINPEYEFRDGVQHRVGHTANNTVIVTITDINSLGPILDDLIAAGGDHVQINQVTFDASDPVREQARLQAQQSALVDARNQAGLIAQTMDVALGKALTIRVSHTTPIHNGPPMQHMAMMARPMVPAPPTPIQPGEIELTERIEVIYEITDKP
jgi:uncharacterized protein